MKIGIVVFPGSNCDRDCHDAVTHYMKQEAVTLWHGDTDLSGVDCVLLPGGFSYGDYLRAGAIARFSPIMQSVKQFADQGRPVLGICNGFQVLTESGLLPGTLMKNQSLAFQCQQVAVRVERTDTPFTSKYAAGTVIQLPIAHAEGNFYAEPDVIAQLEDNHQVVFRYESDVNGSVNRIAGVCNTGRNVVGLMPHPERNLWPTPDTWSGEGAGVFDSLLATALASIA
jgi:phosphoribosylformylglycinamidine synthase